MRTRAVYAHVLTLLLCMLLLVLVLPSYASRTEEVLFWDSGSPEHLVTGRAGQKLAVMFQAPEWAVWVTEIRFYIMNDFITNPTNPELPTTEPFLAYVWTPTSGTPVLPDLPANEGVDSGELYPEDAWLYLVLPEPVNISDPGEFPDRVFFVGMEWLHRLNPFIGEDPSYPLDYMGWYFNWSTWELRTDTDTMIRAVVSDTLVSPVESRTWSTVKALYR